MRVPDLVGLKGNQEETHHSGGARTKTPLLAFLLEPLRRQTSWGLRYSPARPKQPGTPAGQSSSAGLRRVTSFATNSTQPQRGGESPSLQRAHLSLGRDVALPCASCALCAEHSSQRTWEKPNSRVPVFKSFHKLSPFSPLNGLWAECFPYATTRRTLGPCHRAFHAA